MPGVAACSLTAAKTDDSTGASAAVAWGEKGVAEANASATAFRQAVLTTDMSTGSGVAGHGHTARHDRRSIHLVQAPEPPLASLTLYLYI